MLRTAMITLDGTEFSVPAPNIGQLEQITAAFAVEGGTAKVPYVVIRTALQRATPKADLDTLSPSLDEIGAAVAAILVLSGLQKPDANPPTVKPLADLDPPKQ